MHPTMQPIHLSTHSTFRLPSLYLVTPSPLYLSLSPPLSSLPSISLPNRLNPSHSSYISSLLHPNFPSPLPTPFSLLPSLPSYLSLPLPFAPLSTPPPLHPFSPVPTSLPPPVCSSPSIRLSLPSSLPPCIPPSLILSRPVPTIYSFVRFFVSEIQNYIFK